MSGPVDALTRLGELADEAIFEEDHDDLLRIAEAVAELIAALRNAPCCCEDGEGGERDIVCDRCAALARVGGAP